MNENDKLAPAEQAQADAAEKAKENMPQKSAVDPDGNPIDVHGEKLPHHPTHPTHPHKETK
jgi:hypothetical protein